MSDVRYVAVADTQRPGPADETGQRLCPTSRGNVIRTPPLTLGPRAASPGMGDASYAGPVGHHGNGDAPVWSQVRTSTAPSGNDIADGPGILGVHDDGPVAAKPSPMTRHSDSPHRNDIAMLGPHPARVCTICEPALGQAAQPREPRAPGLPPSDEATGRRRRQAQRATPVSGIGVRPATDTGSLPDGPHRRDPCALPTRWTGALGGPDIMRGVAATPECQLCHPLRKREPMQMAERRGAPATTQRMPRLRSPRDQAPLGSSHVGRGRGRGSGTSRDAATTRSRR